MSEEILPELPAVKDRKKDTFYSCKGIKRFWNGKVLQCQHKKTVSRCKECSKKCVLRARGQSKSWPTCLVRDCSNKAYFGGVDDKKESYCSDHKQPNMIDLRRPRCMEIGCGSQASYGNKGDKIPSRCSTHKLTGMNDIVNQRCIYPNCEKFPSYGDSDTKLRRYCAFHKMKGMIDLASRKCTISGCGVIATYGNEKDKRPNFCVKHKTDGMLNIKQQRCTYPDCRVQPCFGNEDDERPSHCFEHKEETMVDIKNRRCIHPDCDKQPNYGYEGDKRSSYCASHRVKGMIDLLSHKCIYPGCEVRPSYGYEDDSKSSYCVKHKKSDMIDICHHKCSTLNCTIRPSYGLPGGNISHCFQHKELGYVKNPKVNCQMANCNLPALFGFTNAVHCKEHKSTDEIDLTYRPCVNCHNLDILYDNLKCSMCDPSGMRRTFLAKQKTVKRYIDGRSTPIPYISYDQMIKGACSKERPDFLYDCNIHHIVLEVDEYQHSNRDQEYELLRMERIASNLGTKVLFLRWNPDKYKTSGTQETIDQRLESLWTELVYWQQILLPDDGTVFVVKMYFDGDDPGEWRTLTAIL